MFKISSKHFKYQEECLENNYLVFMSGNLLFIELYVKLSQCTIFYFHQVLKYLSCALHLIRSFVSVCSYLRVCKTFNLCIVRVTKLVFL